MSKTTTEPTKRHLISREIGIDMGHRVTYHGSKCRNLHGHRYTIHAICSGPLYTQGEQQGMVLDFGFLKELMMALIDEPCDHGLCLWWKDPLLETILGDEEFDTIHTYINRGLLSTKKALQTEGVGGKMYLVPFVPTAENLARHWYELLKPAVEKRSDGQATLEEVKVWETPNCWASYTGE